MNTTGILAYIAVAVLTQTALAYYLFRRLLSQNDLSQQQERSERELRAQIQLSEQTLRNDLNNQFAHLQQGLTAQLTQSASLQQKQIEQFSEQLEKLRQSLQDNANQARGEQGLALQRLTENLQQSLSTLTESNTQRLQEVRLTLEQKLQHIQKDNSEKLEQMRQTVDEKLHATLEQRLGQSFKLVSERLEQVHRGLGEMQQLATGVGDLKKVLMNVKTRGVWGEMQLAALLEQILTPEQYAKNVETIPGSGARVEFALRLPGKNSTDQTLWLPIDAKFPKEQHERLMDAVDKGDSESFIQAGKELEKAVRLQAKTIAEKYLSPPLTTDFAILFLATESLYAEVLKRPGLADELQHLHRVCLAGPATLAALLNSLQMGFRTLALEQRSIEVWSILGAVKTEFTKFGDVLAKTRSTLENAAKNIEQAETRSRAMSRKLKSVEALPVAEAAQLIGPEIAL